MLQDEIMTHTIEVSALTQKNQALQNDNASLLQRWIDKMNLTAEELNASFEKEQSAKRVNKADLSKSKEGF
jgi:hypothetical protein